MDSVAINMDENSIRRDHIASLMIDSQLHECVRRDNIEAFKSLVQTHLAEELVTPCRNTLLHIAVSYGSDKITSYLAEEFPSLITTQNSQQDTVLHLAAREGKDTDAIKSLVESNPSVARMTNENGNTPLHDAAIKGNRELAIFLVAKDPEVAYYNNMNGRSPLYLAVENGNKNGILDDLLKSGASISIYREDGDALPKGKSPVHAAIERRDKDILEKIEKAKPELLRLTDEELGNSLHYASSIGFLKGVQFLLDKFLDGAYERDSEGNYPIHIACKSHSVDVVKEYLDIFPYPKEFLNKKGQNILHVAAKYGKWSVISYILKQDPKLVEPLVNATDKFGNTPLHLAACHGRSMASFLLVRDNRVERFIVNNENWTPYDLAEQQSITFVEKLDKANEMLGKEQKISENSNPSKMLDGRDNSKDVVDGMTNSTAENSTDWTSSERKDKAKRDTEKASPKDEGLITFFRVATTLSILYVHARPKKSIREYFTVTPGQITSQAKEESKNRIGNLLVIAVLVAGVTFAGAVQLPQLRDNSNSREHHHESNSTITASHYSSYENLLYGYLCFDVGAFYASMVAALILLWASFTDARFLLLGVQFAAIMVFCAIIMMFFAFLLSVRIALLGSPDVWSLIPTTVLAEVSFLVLALLFLPWIFSLPVDPILKRFLLNYMYFFLLITLFYTWRWLPEKLPELPDLKKKLKHPRENIGKVEICRIPHL